MINYITAIILLVLLQFSPLAANAEDDKEKTKPTNPPVVIATIKPIYAMAAAVLGDVAKPELLINNRLSEHDYSLKPSDMKKLQGADIILFTSMDLETFMVNVTPSLRKGTVAVELAAAGGVTRQDRTDSDISTDDHDHGAYDPHIWLSPTNAVAMVKQIAKIISLKDTKNRGIYELNAKNYIKKISAASEKITLRLAPYKNIPFIVFHDAYGYFVKAYGLNQVASVSLNPELPLSAEKVSDINTLIKKKHIYCVFADPSFKEDTVRKIMNDPNRVKLGTLDAIGTSEDKSADAYIAILNGVANNLLSCIGNENG